MRNESTSEKDRRVVEETYLSTLLHFLSLRQLPALPILVRSLSTEPSQLFPEGNSLFSAPWGLNRPRRPRLSDAASSNRPLPFRAR